MTRDYVRRPVYRPAWIAVVIGVAMWGGGLLLVAWREHFWPFG